ncbi:50S ribosomal protein L25 [Syntrophorhabdus aromaticivorans]|uniref:Large ribosomal subunit protein bL25 n=1 Tax=Syntrophorhabdus aromaticivorans TaxID=328301 RepID=A0A971M7C2_9BACT|nr:50S ribosomal protein L25 [Syntrophorhabdus aromaticivorans]NLW36802.1 50S ribosomal protein L25 [Syntrophorhabdus aromaticivorans]
MEEILLRAETRKGRGKGVVRKLRREGNIPAVLYGKDIESTAIMISAREWVVLTRHVRKNVILNMELHTNKGVEKRPVMIKDVQKDFLGNDTFHIDFLQVSMERAIEIDIPIHLTGVAKGTVDDGIVEQHLRTVRVECLPTQIPEKIEVDVTDLGIGDSFHVGDISLPGIKLLDGVDVAVVTVIPPEMKEKPVTVEEVEPEKKEE